MKAMKKLGALVLSLALALTLVVVPSGNAKAASTVRIWFDNTGNWSTVYAMAWNTTTSTSETDYGMDISANVNEDGWYYVDIDASTDFGMLFDNGAWPSEGGAQTCDVNVAAGTTECWVTWATYDKSVVSSATDAITERPDGAPSISAVEEAEPEVVTHMMYFDNSGEWENVYFYVADEKWTPINEWPGDEVTTIDEDGWYCVDLDAYSEDAYYVIFSDGIDGTEGGLQTCNIIIPSTTGDFEVTYADYMDGAGNVEAVSRGDSNEESAEEYTVDDATYTIVDSEKKTVEFTSYNGKKKAEVPATVKIDGVKYKVTKVSADAFAGNETITSVTIGKNVKKISAKAFKGCKNLKTITINSEKLTKVGKNAFKGCKNLTKIKVPSKAIKKVVKTVFDGKIKVVS